MKFAGEHADHFDSGGIYVGQCNLVFFSAPSATCIIFFRGASLARPVNNTVSSACSVLEIRNTSPIECGIFLGLSLRSKWQPGPQEKSAVPCSNRYSHIRILPEPPTIENERIKVRKAEAHELLRPDFIT